MLNDSILSDLIVRASALDERLSVIASSESFERDEPVVSERFQRWRERAAQGNQLKFANRLSWDGHNEASARAMLSDFGPATEPNPPWATTLHEILEGLVSRNGAEPDWIHDEASLAFEEILYPFVQYALEKLSVRDLPKSLRQALAYNLLRRLTGIAAPALESLFSERRTCGENLLARLAEEINLNPTRTLYQSFVAEIRAGAYKVVFERFPVLARCMGMAIVLWVEEVSEFFQRLDGDRPALERAFNNGAPLGELVEIEGRLSDPHNGGRTVRILTFASGVKIVYKPRDLGLELAWCDLLEWLNSSLDRTPLWTPKVLSRDGYGWVEFVAPVECSEKAAFERFYSRAGMLLCLVYVLQGFDFHRENILASGEHPVLIDLETILAPEVNLGARMERLIEIHCQTFRSVLGTGLLPKWEEVENGGSFDISGLGSLGDDEVFGEDFAWRRLNTDAMHRVVKQFPVPKLRNAPVVAGVIARAEEHVEEIATGFERMYRILMERRREILAPDGPLDRFRGRKVRIIYRGTALYASLLSNALSPECLVSGVERGLELELLARTFHVADAPEGLSRIFKAEIHAMEQLDIPYFTATTDSVDFAPDGIHPIRGFFRRSGLDAARSAFGQLSEGDLLRQLEFIHGSFYAKVAGAAEKVRRRELISDSLPSLDKESLICRAAEIGKQIVSRAFGEDCSLAAWMDLQLMPQCRRYQFQLLGPGLYGGVSGIAVFLAALHSLTGDNASRTTALAALSTARMALTQEGVDPDWARVFVREMGIGAGEGISSLVYAHSAAARLLNDASLLEHAAHLSQFIDDEMIASDKALDVLGGCAGAILSLLVLWEQTSDRDVLQRAVACGERLLETQIKTGPSAGAWIGTCGRALTGFSHGAAGNAYALARLYSETGNPSFKSAVVAALEYERREFSPTESNWPDYRAETPGWALGWCSGAPGIGLSRVGLSPYISDSDLLQETEAAVRAINEHQPPAVDHVCCGVGGHIELLLEVGCAEAAHQLAAQWIGTADRLGGFRLFANLPPSAKSYGFFQGLSGIGYQMLRLAAPERVPSVLLFR